MEQNLKDLLIDKYISSPKGWHAWIRSESNKYLIDLLNAEYPGIKDLKEQMFWLVNGLVDYPKCPTCGGDIKSFSGRSYKSHCCCTCTQLDPLVKAKLKETNINKYGVENPTQAPSIQEKMKKTCIAKYGVENAFASELIKQKIKETNLCKYGVENPQQNKDIKEKTKATLISKYNVTCGFLHKEEYNVSKGELELFDFVKSLVKDAKHSDRNVIWPLELDIYIESLNIGIEYDGDYWHSLPNMIQRDIKKNNKCLEKGITLIRVKESEWHNNPDLVKNLIKETIKQNGN